MYELLELSSQEAHSLLSMIREAGVFNDRRAVYWPCTTALLASDVYRKIESAVEAKLGRPVYFIFDELFTPAPKRNFEVWHKDVEDENFDDGCWNVWIPLYSSGDEVSQLEILLDESISEFRNAIESNTPWVGSTEIRPDEVLFIYRNGGMEERLVSKAELESKAVPTSKQKNTVHLFNSGYFHRATPSQDFNIRFGIKFSASPYRRTYNMAEDILLFSHWHHALERDMPAFGSLSPRDKHYAVARAVHENAAHRYNGATVHQRALYQALIDSLLRELAG